MKGIMSKPTEGLTGTGIRYGAERARPELLQQRRAGEHLWIVVTTHVVSPEALRGDGTMVLDGENLASLDVGCWICEQAYAERLTYRQCPGEPK